MALVPVFEIRFIVTYKSVDREKIRNYYDFCARTMYKNQQRYYIIEHAGHKSKSGQVRLYSTSGTLFLLFVQQTCQNVARISSISLVCFTCAWMGYSTR